MTASVAAASCGSVNENRRADSSRRNSARPPPRAAQPRRARQSRARDRQPAACPERRRAGDDVTELLDDGPALRTAKMRVDLATLLVD